MEEQIFIQVRFKQKTEVGEYNDAIYYTQDQYLNLDKQTHEIEKQQRIDTWVNSIKNPPPPPNLTKNQLIELKDSLLQQKTDIEVQILDVDSKIIAKG